MVFKVQIVQNYIMVMAFTPPWKFKTPPFHILSAHTEPY